MANLSKMSATFTAQERTLIEYVRKLDFGQILITVKDGKPCHIEEIRKSIPIK